MKDYTIFYEPFINEITADSIVRIDTTVTLESIKELHQWKYDIDYKFIDQKLNTITYYIIPREKINIKRQIELLKQDIHQLKMSYFRDLISQNYFTCTLAEKKAELIELENIH